MPRSSRAYDWADPADPRDVYRELAIGAIEGTLRFLRGDDLAALAAAPAWATAARAASSTRWPGCSDPRWEVVREGATIAIGPDGDRLALVRAGAAIAPAGPTFGELLRYLSLGWSRRSDAEEDLIGALMLRARLRCESKG